MTGKGYTRTRRKVEACASRRRTLSTKVTDEERAEVQVLCDALDCTPAELLRRALTVVVLMSTTREIGSQTLS